MIVINYSVIDKFVLLFLFFSLNSSLPFIVSLVECDYIRAISRFILNCVDNSSQCWYI